MKKNYLIFGPFHSPRSACTCISSECFKGFAGGTAVLCNNIAIHQGELKVQFTAKGTPTEPDKHRKTQMELTLRVLKTASTHALYYVINRGESNGYNCCFG